MQRPQRNFKQRRLLQPSRSNRTAPTFVSFVLSTLLPGNHERQIFTRLRLTAQVFTQNTNPSSAALAALRQTLNNGKQSSGHPSFVSNAAGSRSNPRLFCGRNSPCSRFASTGPLRYASDRSKSSNYRTPNRGNESWPRSVTSKNSCRSFKSIAK